MSFEEMMKIEAESGEWILDDSDDQTVELDGWINDLINEKVERDLHRQYAWY